MTKEEAIKYGIEWLKDEYLDAKDGAFIKIALEALEQKPCENAISRQAVIEQTYNWSKNEFLRVTNPFYYLRKKINDLPSVNPLSKNYNIMYYTPELKTGHWIDADGDNAICSCCNRLNHLYGTYCKHCGAKMVEPQKNEEI